MHMTEPSLGPADNPGCPETLGDILMEMRAADLAVLEAL